RLSSERSSAMEGQAIDPVLRIRAPGRCRAGPGSAWRRTLTGHALLFRGIAVAAAGAVGTGPVPTGPRQKTTASYGKKMPFRSCPVSANRLVEVAEWKLKPLALLPDQATVAWLMAYSPAKVCAASLTLSRCVTGPDQVTSKLTVASTDGP